VAGESERRGPGPLQDVAADLASTGIELLTETRSHYLVGRANMMALVERTPAGTGSIGGTGILIERGLAYLVWRDRRAMLAGKGFEVPATDEQLAALRAFSLDLKTALDQRR
jgi:hypothetical protein